MKSPSCNNSFFALLYLVVDGPDLRQLGPVVGVFDAGGLDLEKGKLGKHELEFCFDFFLVCMDTFHGFRSYHHAGLRPPTNHPLNG